MATLLLQAAGAALGSVFGPVGAIVGRAAGALAGSVVDRALLSGGTTVTGPRLATARIPGADEGTPVSRLYGTARIGGTLIWATRFEEEATKERASSKATGPTVETFRYFANFAIGLCEGPVAAVRRVWADGQEIDLTGIEMRLHKGDEDQLPDPLIEAKQGEGNAPAYRGLAYLVFERLPLDTYGNRIPLLQFEVLRPVGRLERQIRAVTLIPGATEHGYATDQVTEKTGEGSARILNRNTLTAATDWQASLDTLQALCPALESVALVVSWFGTDLRAGECRILPGVEVQSRQDESSPWSVAGIDRAGAHLVSRSNGGPAYGGTPSDASVLQAIADLKARGLKIYLYPFLMMDVPVGNGLPDPQGGIEQAPYPWRGRITCHPGPGQPGSADRSDATRVQVDAFHAGAEGYRRMVLHYAGLSASAGGVNGFIIGSELRGLTTLRDAQYRFPFVEALVDLAAEIRTVVGPATQLTYGADWSEYFGFHPQDGSGDVFFHLDPLWASSAIDAVGIDNYMPLSDWRDADLSAANPDGFVSADDAIAMRTQIAGGEGYDWYYASDADRMARIRSSIADGLAGKPWIFRYKDIEAWWANRHYDRAGNAERQEPTAWLPAMKPVWFTELGCPAVDKGANQPNVFVDPKSAESSLPYFSSGARSDSQQRRFLEAHHDWWQASAAGDMVDPAHVFVWSWDARPQPAFPDDLAIWSDGDNWRSGHWLNGRLGTATLADTIAAILTDNAYDAFDVSAVSGDLCGYVQSGVTSPRDLLEALMEVFQIDVAEDGPTLVFRSRLTASLPPCRIDVVVDAEDEPLWSETRGHDSDLPAEAVLTSFNPVLDYEQASVRSRRIPGPNGRIATYDLPATLAEEVALSSVEGLLRAKRIGQRSLSFALSPADASLSPGDVVTLSDGPEGSFVIDRIEEGAARRISASAHAVLPAPRPVAANAASPRRSAANAASNGFAPLVAFLDLPRLPEDDGKGFACVAALSRPWRRMAVSSSPAAEGYLRRAVLDRPARIGKLTAPFGPGLSGRLDWSSAMEFDLHFGELASASKIAMLGGDNRLVVLGRNGVWEILGFLDATEVAAERWQVSGLLRGLAGTEDAMASGADAGAPVVVLDDAVMPLGLSDGERGRAFNWLVENLGPAGGRSGPFVFAGGMRAQTPIAPVHLRAARLGSGDVRFSWIRRGRLDADDWDATDIPLDEPQESYRIDILSAGGETLRSEDVGEPGLIYPAALEIADFGTPQTAIAFRVRQLGRAVPSGLSASVTANL